MTEEVWLCGESELQTKLNVVRTACGSFFPGCKKEGKTSRLVFLGFMYILLQDGG